MRKMFFTLFLCTFIIATTLCQTGSAQALSSPKKPTQTDTLFYPFYNGVQMIEIDHLSYWDKRLYYFLHSDSVAVPRGVGSVPIGNEFFFRDTTGKIIKAYNTLSDLATLTQQFNHIPLNRQSNGILPRFHYQRSESLFEKEPWVYSRKAKFLFTAYHKVSNQYALSRTSSGIRYGLIDTFGNIKLPIEYEDILPIHDNLLVGKKDNWGIINREQKVIVPIAYDFFINYNMPPEDNDFIYFLKNGKYVAIYNVATTRLLETKPYDNIHDNYIDLGYFVVEQNGLFGLMNLNGKMVLPAIYDRIENRHKKGNYYYAKAIKKGKTVEVRVK